MENKIILGDSKNHIKDIPTDSVDFILTDPPYKLDNHGGGKNQHLKRKLTDKHIDFISDGFDMDFYFIEFERVCKIVNIAIFCSNKQISSIMKYWEDKNYSTTLLVWDKPNPVPFGNGKYISNLEFIIFIRGKNVTYNNIGYKDQLKTFSYSSPSSSIRKHPTEKPVELLERLLKIHTNENDIVLDAFAGSGTTGVACKNLNRKYILIEQLEEYFNVIKDKLLDDYNDNNLFEF